MDKMQPLYFAPINVFGNYVYRHFLLGLGADYVFSELMIVSKFGMPEQHRKFKIFTSDIPKTVFQIGVESTDEIIKGVNYIHQKFPEVKEININMGCPQSTMQKSFLCSGVMFHPKKMKDFSNALFSECSSFNIIPSVKMRLGTNPEDEDLEKYVGLISSSGIKKIYIHTRYLRYNYSKPALYEKVTFLSKRFPDVMFVFNGDIDSFDRFNLVVSYGSNGALIGRAALHNPLIFEQIKNKDKPRSKHFNPIENDLSVDIIKGVFVLSDRKKQLLLEFIALCEEVKELILCKRNLLYMLKGISNRQESTDLIQKADSFDNLRLIFNQELKKEKS